VKNVNRKRERQDELKREALEVCDVIITQAKERFHLTGHLEASNLF